MKKLTWFIFLNLFVFYSFSQGWRPGEMEVKIKIAGTQDIEKLMSVTRNFEPANGSQFHAYILPAELEILKKSGLRYEITIADLNKQYEHFWDNPNVPTGYYTYEQIIAIADSLATNFPSICKKEVWGTSVVGRQLAALKISDNVNVNEDEPTIMFDGGIHGDEVGGSQNIIMFARELCLKYSSDPAISDLINSREIWLYLMVNPDGRVAMSRYNNNTVDVNRDNGYMWNGEGFSPSAFSQVETKTLRDALQRNHPVVYTNYHSGTEVIAFPWSYRSNACRDYDHINELAGKYSSTSAYTSALAYGQGYNIMYAINGSTKDVQYGSLGNVGWSIEISNDKQPPSSQISYYYEANKPAMLEMIKRCGYGISGTITDSLTGDPVQATVWLNNFYPIFNEPEVGDYHKYVLPGTYSVKITANGYKTKTANGIIVPTQGTAVIDFQLLPDTGWYAFKVMSCQIPNNNFGDEGYTPGCTGQPDNTPYSIGRNGWVVLDMGDTIYDGTGNDFKVIQSGSVLKSFTVSGGTSQDGPFVTIGTGNGTTSFDLNTTLMDKIRYLKIKDNNNSPASGNGAGYNLDGVLMITPPMKVRFSASNHNPCEGSSVNFTDQSTGNIVSWNWSFPGGTPSTSNLQNPTGITYATAGTYPVTLSVSNGISTNTKTRTNFVTVLPKPSVNLGNDKTVCADITVILDAGNPGSGYLWSTGETSQTIVVDSTGVGIGSQKYWVRVINANNCAGSDTIKVTYDDCTGLADNQIEQTISINPNPVKDHVEILINGLNGGTWELMAISGKKLASATISSDKYRHNLQLIDIKPGVAFIRISRDKTVIVRKIVITP